MTHHRRKLSKEPARLLGSRARLWVVLDRKDRLIVISKPLNRAIKEISVRNLRDRFYRIWHGVVVVLRGDFDFLGNEVFYGVVASVMSEF